MYHVRKYTNKILDALDNDLLTYEQVVTAALKFMSEDDVKAMAEANEFFILLDDEEDEDKPFIGDFAIELLDSENMWDE